MLHGTERVGRVAKATSVPTEGISVLQRRGSGGVTRPPLFSQRKQNKHKTQTGDALLVLGGEEELFTAAKLRASPVPPAAPASPSSQSCSSLPAPCNFS